MKKLLALLLCLLLLSALASPKARKKSHRKAAHTGAAKKDAETKSSQGIPCSDGTISHAKSTRGACSHHGGIRH
jgi:hypothetical protein